VDDRASAVPSAEWHRLLEIACPDYEFKNFVKAGGQAFGLLVYDSLMDMDLFLKLYKPSPKKTGVSADAQSYYWDKDHIRAWMLCAGIQQKLATKIKNILPIYGRKDGLTPWVAMEYVENGKELFDWIQAKKQAEIVQLWIGIAKTVQEMHEYGYLHADLKTGNILVREGLPVLLDFDVSRPSNPNSELAKLHGQFVLSPGYQAPEQMGLADTSVTENTDIYQLSVLLCAMIAKKTPRSIFSDNRLISEIPLSDCPGEFREIVMMGRSYEITQRPASVEKLIELVTVALAGSSPAAPLTPQKKQESCIACPLRDTQNLDDPFFDTLRKITQRIFIG